MKGLDAIQNKIDRLQDFQSKANKYSVDAIEENKAIVLDMNFEEQLFEEGINRNDVPIMDYKPYSPVTEMIKAQKGQPYDRVTLRDKGDFGDEGDLQRNSDVEIEIISNDEKSPWLQHKYGKEILGLKEDNMEEMREYYVKPFMIDKLKEV